MEDFEESRKDWRRCFEFALTECDDVIIKACQGTKLIAVFNSNANSCITIWSFPIWLWDAMAPFSGYQHTGIIRPQDFTLPGSDTQTSPTVPDRSSNVPMGEDSLSPQ